MKNYIKFLCLVSSLAIFTNVQAQIKMVTGTVLDSKTNQPIWRASIYLKGTSIGDLTDSNGHFEIACDKAFDSIQVSSIGYTKGFFKYNEEGRTYLLENRSTLVKKVVVHAQHGNPAEAIMKKVVAAKSKNTPMRFDNYTYNAYNKAELDLNNYDVTNSKSLQGVMQNTFNSLDTSNKGNKQLPVYFIETLSRNYHSNSPLFNQEQIVAKKTLGLETDVLIRHLEKFQFTANIYDNWIPLFNKTFASPLADNGTTYYKYYFSDSAIVNGKKQYEIEFSPRNSYESAFSGWVWINDETFSVFKIEMRITKNANLNFVKNIIFNEEFALFPNNNNEQVYMPKSWKTDVQFESGLDILGIPIPPKSDAVKMNYINTKVFDSIVINAPKPAPLKVLLKTQDIKNQYQQSEEYWAKNRLDSLSIHEAAIYQMIDSMKHNQHFELSAKVLAFAGTGFWDVKDKVRFGPYSSLLSMDRIEGLRIRCGFWTLPGISEKWNLSGYAAYGTKDGKFKGGGTIKYLHSNTSWNKTYLSARSDYDVIIDYEDELDRDNLLSSVLRKNVPSFRSYIHEITLGHEHQLTKMIMNKTAVTYKQYDPVFQFSYHPEDHITDLPIDTAFLHTVPIAEVSTHFRITKDQPTLIRNYDLLYMPNYFKPVLNIGYTFGFETSKTNFEYHRFSASVEQNLRLPPKMMLRYKLAGGLTLGTVPYILLNSPKGNEFYVSSKYSFNTMVPYEFASDKFVSAQLRLSGGGILLDHFPLIKKMGWRERVTVNSFMGDLTGENKRFNALNSINVANTVPFAEVGAGIENIFHVLSIEYYRRLTYLQNPYAQKGALYLGFEFNF